MKDLLSKIELFYSLVKRAETGLAPSPTFTSDPQSISQKASEALAKGDVELKNFLKEYGTDMSKAFPGRAFIYNFTEKPGSTCLFDNHIVHFNSKLIPVEKEARPEMKTDFDSAVKFIVKWIKKDSATTDIANNPDAVKNLVINLLGQKSAEGSQYNYNFGFIQLTKNEIPGSDWKGHVFVIQDYNTRNGAKVSYIWPYVSFTNFEDGINYWLNFLKKRGFINAAKTTGEAFVESLQKGKYFDLPTKKIVDPNSGQTKIVVDEEKAKIVRDKYYKNSLRVTQDQRATKAIDKYVYGKIND